MRNEGYSFNVNTNFEVGMKEEKYDGLAKGITGRRHSNTHEGFYTELRRLR
jgi:hypothetical protein